MNLNSLKRTRLVAIKNFDDELYRLIKAYASLEGRTIASIVEEALRYWMESRGDYNEVRLWVDLDREYEENFKIFQEAVSSSPDAYKEGFMLICNKHVIGVFSSYEDAAKKAKEKCKGHALIVELPYEKSRKLELGLPW